MINFEFSSNSDFPFQLVTTGTSLTVFLIVRRLLIAPKPEDLPKKDSKHQQYPLLTSAGELSEPLLELKVHDSGVLIKKL